MSVIVHELEPVTLIGGGPCAAADIWRAVDLAPFVVAADGGAARALAAGLMPDAVIGDFDSIDAASRAAIAPERLHVIKEQESTDFDKALRNIEAPLVLGVGFSGGRLDHQLAALTTLVRYPERRCILIGAQDLVFLAPPKLEMVLPMGSLLSLYPMGEVRGVSRGLRWDIDGVAFAPDWQSGTSNEVTGRVRLSFGAPKMLVILPVAALPVLIEQLILTASQWPARAEPYRDPRPA